MVPKPSRRGISGLRAAAANDKLQTTPKDLKKVRTALDTNYSYLAGNAVSRDKKGNVVTEDAGLAAEMAAAGMGSEYAAYVYYEVEIP